MMWGCMRYLPEPMNWSQEQESNGFTVMEIMYSVGIAVGIIVFYNHFGGKRITKDPTPIEVQMRLYEDDVNTTLVEGCNREETSIDVD